MAKYITKINGHFDTIVDHIKREMRYSSISASLEEEVYIDKGDIKICTLAFERFSYSDGNRLSLHVTIVEKDNDIDIVGICSGGNNGLFLKINTFGEDEFLKKFKQVLKKL